MLLTVHLEYGYYLDLPIGRLNFGTGEQAPSEAYMSQNYTVYVILFLSLTHNPSSESCVVASPVHQDNLYAPYALNWVTENRVFDLKAVRQPKAEPRTNHHTRDSEEREEVGLD